MLIMRHISSLEQKYCTTCFPNRDYGIDRSIQKVVNKYSKFAYR